MTVMPALNISELRSSGERWVDMPLQSILDIPADQLIRFAVDSQSVGEIFIGNILENLDQARGLNLLRECRRLLEPTGRILVAYYDLDSIVEQYERGEIPPDSWAINIAGSAAEGLNLALRDGGRRWLYNRRELVRTGDLAGLEAVPEEAADAAPDWIRIQRDQKLLCFTHRLVMHQASSAAQLVSIMIPAYNPRYYTAALQSALDQDYDHLEIVICDDSPNDEIGTLTRSIAGDDPRVRYLKNPVNLGRYGNYQRCFEEAQGHYIKYLNDDDIIAPHCVTYLARCLDRYPAATLATSRRQLIDGSGTALADLPATKPIAVKDSIFDGITVTQAVLSTRLNFVGEPTTAMFRKPEMQGLGPVINSISGISIEYINDVAMWLYLLGKGDMIYIAQPLSQFRLHAEQGQADTHAVRDSESHWQNVLQHGQRLAYWRPSWRIPMKPVPLDLKPRWPEPILAAISRAGAALERGDLTAVKLTMDWALDDQPDDIDLALLKGYLLLQGEDTAAAAEAFKEAILRDPRDDRGYLRLAGLHLKTGDKEQGVKILEGLLEQSPQHATALKLLGDHWLNEHSWAQGMTLLETVIVADPGDTEARMRLGRACLDQNDLRRAGQLFSAVLQIDSSNGAAREYLTAIQEAAGGNIPAASDQPEQG